MHTASSMSRSAHLASRNHVHVRMHAMVNLAVVSRTHVSPVKRGLVRVPEVHWRHVQGTPVQSDNMCTPHVLATGWGSRRAWS